MTCIFLIRSPSHLPLSGRWWWWRLGHGDKTTLKLKAVYELPRVSSAEILLLMQVAINNVENIELYGGICTHNNSCLYGNRSLEKKKKKVWKINFAQERGERAHSEEQNNHMAENKDINKTPTAWNCGAKRLHFDIIQLQNLQLPPC